MSKLRNVRHRQWERYLQYLINLGNHLGYEILCPEGMIHEYNRDVRRQYYRINRGLF